MSNQYVVTVVVEGPPNSGKTITATIIEKALRDYGFDVEANPRTLEFGDGGKLEEMSVDSYEKLKDRMLSEEFKKAFVAKRKVVIKQRAKRREV